MGIFWSKPALIIFSGARLKIYYFLEEPQALVARTYHPLFSNFLFTNLFSIKFLYFFIISSLFPYFNLLVSIFMQSYVNIKGGKSVPRAPVEKTGKEKSGPIGKWPCRSLTEILHWYLWSGSSLVSLPQNGVLINIFLISFFLKYKKIRMKCVLTSIRTFQLVVYKMHMSFKEAF